MLIAFVYQMKKKDKKITKDLDRIETFFCQIKLFFQLNS